MAGEWFLDVVCLAGMVTAAALIVWTPNLNSAVMALSALGTLLTLLFVVLDAPDVAHAEVVVGAIATPVLYLVGISRVRSAVSDVGELGDLGEVAEDYGGD